METMVVKKRFYVWQDDKEEIWLSDMAQKGWHLLQFNPSGKYTFIKGEPRKVRYCLDYINPQKDFESYKMMFQDAGWEYLGQMGGWQYFRKEYEGDEVPEIFTDCESKIQRYYRILSIYVAIFLCCGLSPLYMFILFSTNNMGISSFIKGFLAAVSIGIISTGAFLLSSVLGKINKLKKNRLI